MTSVLVLSDTHLSNPDSLPEVLLKRAAECDLVVHCGDIDSIEIIRRLEAIKRTLYVRGNCDTSAEFESSPEKLLFRMHGKTICVLHSMGRKIPPITFLAVFHPVVPDIVLFGHTHMRFAQTIGSTFFLNPGSVSMPKDTGRSFAVLHVTEDEIRHEFAAI